MEWLLRNKRFIGDYYVAIVCIDLPSRIHSSVGFLFYLSLRIVMILLGCNGVSTLMF